MAYHRKKMAVPPPEKILATGLVNHSGDICVQFSLNGFLNTCVRGGKVGDPCLETQLEFE